MCFIAVTEGECCGAGGGGGEANWPDTDAQRDMTEKLDGQEGMGSSDAYGDCQDAAQSVTHLDVLACVVAS